MRKRSELRRSHQEPQGYITRDPEAFRILFERHYSKLVVFATSILYDEQEAKDIVQDVFYKLWDNADKVHTQTCLSSYLFAAVKNHALNKINHLRIRDRHEAQIREAYLIAGEAKADFSEETLAEMHAIINGMPEQMRKVILLKLSKEATYAEIAEELDLGLNTVKTHLKRAYDVLRKKLLVLTLLFFS